MQDLQGKTAVITGAGSGFGRAFALHCAAQGMNVVLADIEAAALAGTVALLPDKALIAQACNVAKPADMDALADAAYAKFGAVHLLFNNAGIAVTGPVWTATLDEWRWAIDVNVMGVVHGLRSFTQRMIDGGEPGHIVNTASAAGMLSVPGSGLYCATKHAVVTITECLHHELTMLKSKIGVSLLCPAFVKTGIANSERLRPADADKNPHPMTKLTDQGARQAVEKAKVTAEDVAKVTLEAVQQGRFYVFTHERIMPSIEKRFSHIIDRLDPHNSVLEHA